MNGTVSRTRTVRVHFILDTGPFVCHPARSRRKERPCEETICIYFCRLERSGIYRYRPGCYCRKVYLAGFTPICPILYLPHFLNDTIPAEHKDGIDMARELLRRSHVLIVCGDEVDEAVKNDIAVAQRLGITATTLDGILKIRSQGHEEAR